MNRKKFFTSLSITATGIFLLNSFPFKGISKKLFHKTDKLVVKKNPLAVSRKNTGVKNV